MLQIVPIQLDHRHCKWAHAKPPRRDEPCQGRCKPWLRRRFVDLNNRCHSTPNHPVLEVHIRTHRLLVNQQHTSVAAHKIREHVYWLSTARRQCGWGQRPRSAALCPAAVLDSPPILKMHLEHPRIACRTCVWICSGHRSEACAFVHHPTSFEFFQFQCPSW